MQSIVRACLAQDLSFVEDQGRWMNADITIARIRASRYLNLLTWIVRSSFDDKQALLLASHEYLVPPS